MGYNTSILLLNDAAGDIEANPEQFTKNAIEMIHGGPYNKRIKSLPVGRHCNPMSLISHSHADTINLVTIGQNSGNVINASSIGYGVSHHDKEIQIKILKQAANALGYNLVKLPNKKV